MLLLLSIVFWLTITGANYPSQIIANVLVDYLHPLLKSLSFSIGVPNWLSGLLIDGGYLAMAWVISVMLPPMAIFFPLFTLLEDFGYLPRVAFNLDNIYRKVGAHGKQALTMSMGFGCNAAGVIATRVIDSPRERLIAIVTNNFALCTGRSRKLLMLICCRCSPACEFSGRSRLFIAVAGTSYCYRVVIQNSIEREASSFSLGLPPCHHEIFSDDLNIPLSIEFLFCIHVCAFPAGFYILALSRISCGESSLANIYY